MKLNLCLTVAISLTLVGLHAQESTTASGGYNEEVKHYHQIELFGPTPLCC